MKYPMTVKAALTETASKFKLAEALAREIPKGSSPKVVATLIEEARQEVIAAGGEDRAAETFHAYRRAALWVADNGGFEPTSFAWVKGYSYTAHRDAMESGRKFSDFAASPARASSTLVQRAESTTVAVKQAVQEAVRVTKERAAEDLKAVAEAAERRRQQDLAKAERIAEQNKLVAVRNAEAKERATAKEAERVALQRERDKAARAAEVQRVAAAAEKAKAVAAAKVEVRREVKAEIMQGNAAPKPSGKDQESLARDILTTLITRVRAAERGDWVPSATFARQIQVTADRVAALAAAPLLGENGLDDVDIWAAFEASDR